MHSFNHGTPGSGLRTASIVQGNPALAEELRLELSHLGVVGDTHPTAEAYLALPESSRPGCVLCDFVLPGMSGLDLLRRLGQGAGSAVIFVSDQSTVRLAVEAMALGAISVLPRPYELGELKSALTEAATRREQADLQREIGLPHAREIRSRMRLLTPNERTVMDAIIAGRSNKSIAQEQELGLRTIEAHRQQIFRKLGVDSVAQLVASVLMVRLDPAQPLRAPHFLTAQNTDSTRS